MPADPHFDSLETRRLVIRRFRGSDVAALATYLKTRRSDPSSETAACEIDEQDASIAELRFRLAKDRQGRGLATEAVAAVLAYSFDRLWVRGVFAVTDARNLPSIALLQRVEMHRAETRRVEFKNECCDELVYEVALPAHPLV